MNMKNEYRRMTINMEIDIFKHDDQWQNIKDSTMNTIGKTTGKYPTSEWKRKLIISEHSPIRIMKFYWRLGNYTKN